MINITVDLTNINARLDKMQDYFSVDKTENGKKFISLITQKSVDIFQEQSLERIDTHTPPNSSKHKSGKIKSMRKVAKQFTKSLFISEKMITQNGLIIGIGVDFFSKGNIPTPIEPKYVPGDGAFSSLLKNHGIYNPAPDASDDIFLIRHFGSGAHGNFIGYSHAHSYPNNMHILGISGRILSTFVITNALDRFAAISALSDKKDESVTTVKPRLIKRDKLTGEIIEKQVEIAKAIQSEEQKGDISQYYGKDPLLDTILGNIATDNVDDFVHGNFDIVRDKNNKPILMWHHGVRPYDWFHNTMWGNAPGVAFKEDIDRIRDMIVNAHVALLGKI